MRKSNKGIISVLSFIALIIIALLMVVTSPFVGMSGILTNILKTIENVLILIIIGFSAFAFANDSTRKWVKIIYWIAVVIFVAGTVFLWI